MNYPPMTTWRIFPSQLPSVVLGWLYVLLFSAIGFAYRLHVDQGVLCAYWRPWAAKRWRFTTTIGHGMIKSPYFNESTRYHERVHVWFYEDLCVLGLSIGLALLPWLGWKGSLILWSTSGSPWLLPLFLMSVFRWKRRGVSFFQAIYYLTVWERAAYAEEKAHRDGRTDPWELKLALQPRP